MTVPSIVGIVGIVGSSPPTFRLFSETSPSLPRQLMASSVATLGRRLFSFFFSRHTFSINATDVHVTLATQRRASCVRERGRSSR